MKKKKITIIVTGSAGFIGSAVCIKLLKRGDNIIGIDNHNDYYDPKIKESRLERLLKYSNYQHFKADLSDKKKLDDIFKSCNPQKVVNLAAQAGVRYSIENPLAYINSNIVGFANILENCRECKIEHLVYASTSSVYGANTKMPFSEHDGANHPLSVYAASKKSNELMAHSYSFLFKIPTTGLRFFTVYGPWGRPDMALFKFTKNILKNKYIEVYNYGDHVRDFTYIDDVVKIIKKLYLKIPKKNKNWNERNPSSSSSPFRILNVGNGQKVKLLKYIEYIEKGLNRKAKIKYLPKQLGDVRAALSSTKELKRIINYVPKISVKEGVKKFIEWYKSFYIK